MRKITKNQKNARAKIDTSIFYSLKDASKLIKDIGDMP